MNHYVNLAKDLISFFNTLEFLFYLITRNSILFLSSETNFFSHLLWISSSNILIIHLWMSMPNYSSVNFTIDLWILLPHLGPFLRWYCEVRVIISSHTNQYKRWKIRIKICVMFYHEFITTHGPKWTIPWISEFPWN